MTVRALRMLLHSYLSLWEVYSGAGMQFIMDLTNRSLLPLCPAVLGQDGGTGACGGVLRVSR